MSEVLFAPAVLDSVRGHTELVKELLREKLSEARETPEDVLLPIYGEDLYSLRVGSFRAVVDWHESVNKLVVLDFGHNWYIFQ